MHGPGSEGLVAGAELASRPSPAAYAVFREPQGMGLSPAQRGSGELALGLPGFKSQLCCLPALQLWVR